MENYNDFARLMDEMDNSMFNNNVDNSKGETTMTNTNNTDVLPGNETVTYTKGTHKMILLSLKEIVSFIQDNMEFKSTYIDYMSVIPELNAILQYKYLKKEKKFIMMKKSLATHCWLSCLINSLGHEEFTIKTSKGDKKIEKKSADFKRFNILMTYVMPQLLEANPAISEFDIKDLMRVEFSEESYEPAKIKTAEEAEQLPDKE